MRKIEKIIYYFKHHQPWLFLIIEYVSSIFVAFIFARRIEFALSKAGITGSIHMVPSEIRPLKQRDLEQLSEFFVRSENVQLRFFKPHNFDRNSLRKILAAAGYMTYGLFWENKIIGYALLRITPFGEAYVGRIIDEEFQGLGLGKFLASYLYWQAHLARFSVRSTISKKNISSIQSHRSIENFKILSDLPNDYILIEFQNKERLPPLLNL